MKYVCTVLVCVAALVTHACRSFVDPTSPQILTSFSTLSGNVSLISEEGYPMADRQGVNVQMSGTMFATESGPDGRWSIVGIPAGRYTILFSKEGFAGYRIGNYQIVEGDQWYVGNSSLIQLPGFWVDSLSVRHRSDPVFGGYLELGGLLSSPPPHGRARMVRFFVGMTEHVSANPLTYVVTGTGAAYDSPRFTGRIYLSSLEAVGITSGTRVYIVGYGTSKHIGGYHDPSTGRSLFTNINPTLSPVVSIALP